MGGLVHSLYASPGLSQPDGTGSLYGYINDAIPPTASNDPAAPVTWTAGGKWSEIENEHQCLITGRIQAQLVWARLKCGRRADPHRLWDLRAARVSRSG